MEHHTIRAIVRYDIPKLQVSAGLVVLTSSWICQPCDITRRFPAVPEKRLPVLLHFQADALLPLTCFLTRQPSADFLILIDQARWLEGHPECFISDPRALALGRRPFRFESDGELRYYLCEYQLSLSKFLTGRIASLATLTSLPPQRGRAARS